MTATTASTSAPRFGGIFWKLAGWTSWLTLPFAGRRWNPIFAVMVHRGRRSGRMYQTPVAARREGRGFVIALAFGAQVDWFRNLVAAGGGTIRWAGTEYRVDSPRTIDRALALPAFNGLQRVLVRLAGIGGYIRVDDAPRLA